jgi:hypothetical protein
MGEGGRRPDEGGATLKEPASSFDKLRMRLKVALMVSLSNHEGVAR